MPENWVQFPKYFLLNKLVSFVKRALPTYFNKTWLCREGAGGKNMLVTELLHRIMCAWKKEATVPKLGARAEDGSAQPSKASRKHAQPATTPPSLSKVLAAATTRYACSQTRTSRLAWCSSQLPVFRTHTHTRSVYRSVKDATFQLFVLGNLSSSCKMEELEAVEENPKADGFEHSKPTYL